jgi:energy-coupling factor transport system ATP-binding protein
MTIELSPSQQEAFGWVLAAVVLLAVAYVMWRIAKEEYRTANTRVVAYAVVLAAMAAALGHLSVPVEFAKIAPAQHMVNIMGAVLLGPWWATLVAFVAAVIRNSTGAGTPFAFPGGMIGALLAGLAWRATGSLRVAAVGEIVGTGVLAAAVSVWLVAPAILGQAGPALAIFGSFLVSTLLGTTIGVAALLALRRADVVDFADSGFERPGAPQGGSDGDGP